jgi:hypothetical protein
MSNKDQMACGVVPLGVGCPSGAPYLTPKSGQRRTPLIFAGAAHD